MLETRLRRMALAGYSESTTERPRPLGSSRPTVSVVIPCYNYGRYLPACVDSAFDQSDVDVDVIIVDDKSTDDSASVIRQIAASDSRVHAIYHEQNKGHIQTFNDGLEVVTGKYVVLISADDLLTPGALDRAAALMEAHPTVGLVYGRVLDFSDVPPPARTTAADWTIWRGRDWVADRCATGRNALRSPEAVMRSSVMAQVGGYRHELPYASDFGTWLLAAMMCDVGYIGGADQAFYRVHETNMHHAVFDVEQQDGLIRDLQQRLACFELALGADATPDNQLLLARARRSLAAEALRLVIRSYGWGLADSWPVDALMAFAQEICPPEELPRLWRAVRRRQSMGSSKASRNPVLLPTELVHKMRHKADGWRWRSAGV